MSTVDRIKEIVRDLESKDSQIKDLEDENKALKDENKVLKEELAEISRILEEPTATESNTADSKPTTATESNTADSKPTTARVERVGHGAVRVDGELKTFTGASLHLIGP